MRVADRRGDADPNAAEEIRCRFGGSMARSRAHFALRVALVLTASAFAELARADDAPITPPVALRADMKIELPATAGLAVVVVGFRLLRDDLEPSSCRWCDSDTPGKVNAVDDWFRTALRRPDIQPANVTSYALAFGAAPILPTGLTILSAVIDNRGKEWLVDVVAIAEGGLTAMLVTEVLEALVLRTRPYVHAITDEQERNDVIAQTGAFHSFPAGHVVETFGVATSAGVIASKRGYRLAPLVWASGMMIGVATAYTRIAADRHYFTDTLAGAAIGSAIGFAVPMLLHPRVPASEGASFVKHPTLIASPLPGGGQVGLGFAF
jgi:membrane-associated phospholipid phosphatase